MSKTPAAFDAVHVYTPELSLPTRTILSMVSSLPVLILPRPLAPTKLPPLHHEMDTAVDKP